MVAVVLLHAFGPAMRLPIPGLVWPVFQPAPTWLGDWLFWCSRCIESRAFSLIAGFVAARLLARALAAGTPLRTLLRERIYRLGKPLLLGALLVLPAMYAIWGWGWVQFGFATWPKVLEASFGPAVGPHFAGLAHLWFLPACMLSTILLVASSRVSAPVRARVCALARALLSSPARLLVLVPITSVLFHELPSSLVVFANHFFPAPGHYLLHLLCFAVGAGVFLLRQDLRGITRWWLVELIVAAAALTWGVPMLLKALGPTPWYLERTMPIPQLGWNGSMLAALAAWCGLFGTLGACIRVGPHVSVFVAWLVQRQLWVYLAHLPFVGLVWAALYTVPLRSETKAALAFVAGLAGPLLLHAAWTMLTSRRAAARISAPTTPAPVNRA
jgi:glucans biosynthesis protein C